MGRRRNTWAELSESTRKRYLSAGMTEESFDSGDKIPFVKGISRTPDVPITNRRTTGLRKNTDVGGGRA